LETTKTLTGWKKALTVCWQSVLAIGSGFGGTYAVLGIVEHFSTLTVGRSVYLIVSGAISAMGIFVSLYKNNIFTFGIDRKEKAKKQLESIIVYTPAYHLEFDEKTGKIFNRVGDNRERQVLLRADTFNNVLDSVYEFSLSKGVVSANAVLDYCNELIRHGGYKCGKAFADRELPYLKKLACMESQDKTDTKLEKILTAWCKFDSDAGFGKFTVLDLTVSEIDEQVVVKFKISLKESFVSEGLPIMIKNSQHRSKRCEFMRGYCIGVCDVLGTTLYRGYKFDIEDCDKNICRFERNKDSCECIYMVVGRSEHIERSEITESILAKV
jgi:hypothetical protein